MTTTATPKTEPVHAHHVQGAEVGPCPSWCTLAAGHGWDGFCGPEQTPSRMHQGPDFGVAVSVTAMEYAGSSGLLEPARVEVCADADRDPVEAETLARHLQEAAAWVRARSVAAAWWATASNPSCRPWCETEHEPGDFARAGQIACEREVDLDGHGTLRLAQITAADERLGVEAGTLELAAASIDVDLDGCGEFGETLYSVTGALELVEALGPSVDELAGLVVAAAVDVEKVGATSR